MSDTIYMIKNTDGYFYSGNSKWSSFYFHAKMYKKRKKAERRLLKLQNLGIRCSIRPE